MLLNFEPASPQMAVVTPRPCVSREIVSSDEDQGIPSNSLDRALLVLERIKRSRGGLTNSEVSRALGIASSTCSYILSRLAKRGYLARDSRSGKYQIGLKTLALAHSALRDLEIRSLAEPTLYRLVSETGLSASIAVVERGRVLFVDRLESPGFLKDAIEVRNPKTQRTYLWSLGQSNEIRRRELRDIGRELPVHSNAPGKMILAHMPQDQVRNIIQEYGLEKCTPSTIVGMAQLTRELELIRKQGWADSHEEQYMGVSAIAAPIFRRDGEISAAVSLNGSSSDPIWQEPNEMIRIATAAGQEITKEARRR